jgi:hypothetical protein
VNDAELRSLERLCSKDDLSDDNAATLTVLGLKAAREIRVLRHLVKRIDETLRVPAAEYVPAIGDVFTLIDALSPTAPRGKGGADE